MTESELLWKPGKERIANSRVKKFIDFVNERHGFSFLDFGALYTWSVAEKEDFWSDLWDFCAVKGEKGERILENGEDIERAQWFPDARLNFAENMLVRRDDSEAIFFKSEDKVSATVTFQELYDQVAAVSAWLRSIDIQPGDRVAGYLPNMPETIIAMLAAASVGAVWTSTSPDFGFESVMDRFGQTEPLVLFHCDGYYYNGKTVDISERVERLADSLESIQYAVTVPLIQSGKEIAGELNWQKILAEHSGCGPGVHAHGL